MVKFTFCDGLLSVPQVSPKWGTWGTFVKSPPKWGTFVVGNYEVEDFGVMVYIGIMEP